MQEVPIPTSKSESLILIEEEEVKCPRCESINTKFCYYNNYNLSQPRHFCKSCRRYWTKGGSLRNIPIGGGTRKNSLKRASDPSNRPNPKRPKTPPTAVPDPISECEPEQMSTVPEAAVDEEMLEVKGTFSSLLVSEGQFGNFSVDGFGSGGVESGLGDQDPSLFAWSSLWADLVI